MKRILSLAAFFLGVLAWHGAHGEHRARGEHAAAMPLAPDRPIASLVPARCPVFVDASGLLPVLEQGLAHPFLAAVRANALGRTLLARLPATPEAALARADAWLGSSVLARAAELSAHGLALGFVPHGKHAVLVAQGRDGQQVEAALASFLEALARQFGWPGAFDRPKASWSGADVWSLGEAFLARRGALLVLGNDEELVREALALAADPEGQGMLARAAFAAAAESAPPRVGLRVWLAMEELEPEADAGFRALRAANHAPAFQGLLGARLAALAAARFLAIDLGLDEAELELALTGGEGPGVASLLPFARTGLVPALPAAAPDAPDLAQALVYRDYARFLGERAELFEPAVLPQFAEALGNGALFFGGRDLGEEVLPALSPWIRLVARAPEFEPGRKPEIPLPALAAVAVLADEQAGEAWISAFQSLIAVIGVDRAQKGEPGLRLVVGHEGEAEVSAARFATPLAGDGVDVRYNLQPALAVSGRHLILGTHESLVRALVRELAGAAPESAEDARELLRLEAPGLRAAFDQNRPALVAQKMLAEGLDVAAAGTEIDVLRSVLAAFESAHLELGSRDADTPSARLVLRLAPVEEPR